MNEIYTRLDILQGQALFRGVKHYIILAIPFIWDPKKFPGGFVAGGWKVTTRSDILQGQAVFKRVEQQSTWGVWYQILTIWQKFSFFVLYTFWTFIRQTNRRKDIIANYRWNYSLRNNHSIFDFNYSDISAVYDI